MNLPGYDVWRLAGPDDDRCPDCCGSGHVDCPHCEGTGCEEWCDGPGHGGPGQVECETCQGEEPDGDCEYERRRDEYERRRDERAA